MSTDCLVYKNPFEDVILRYMNTFTIDRDMTGVEIELASKQDLRELKSDLTAVINKALLVHSLVVTTLLLVAI